MKKNILFLCLIFFVTLVFADTDSKQLVDKTEKALTTEQLAKASLAMSSADYKVTAGDVYTLAFSVGSNAVSYPIIIDTSYKMKVANLSTIDVYNKTFMEVKNQVEQIISRNYPMSGIQFTLQKPAAFQVLVKGEVAQAIEVEAWALSRLSSLVNPFLTSYSSTRVVTITSANGTKKNYDLFLATRNGDLSQNPYVRPGDTITVNRSDRKVSISGAVERPGTYELLPGENLKELIEIYASGLTVFADKEKVEIIRTVDSTSRTGERIYVSGKDIDTAQLKKFDSVFIPNTGDYLPIVYVEGSVVDLSSQTLLPEDREKAALENMINGNVRIQVRYNDGESWASLVQRNRSWFSAHSDISSAYVVRRGERLLLDLDKILFSAMDTESPIIEPNDTLVVPYKKNEAQVIITGEVKVTKEISGWPLRRLSDILADNLTPYSSERNIEITDVSGISRSYDYFRSYRFGEFEQNPYVRPGDTITVNRSDRKVSISGAVERPGTYELLPGENLKELIEIYASGLTLFADVNRIELTRYNGSMNEVGDKYFYKEEAITSNIALNDHDSISIMSLQDLIPVMFMEGAVFQSTALDDARLDRTELAAPEDTANRVTVRFIEGENYGSLVRRNRNLLTAASDTQKASIIRKGVIIPFDINPLLYDSNYYTDEIVQPYDVLLIPFRQYFVIDGEVTSTGEIEAKGLTRLASVVRPYFTPYSSSRNILVTSASGTIHTYDLFEAERNGDFSQNPYLSPGDRITVQRAERTVTIGGAVERPGTYELLEGENLKELIEKYASGLTVFADSSRIELTRYEGSSNKEGDKLFLSEEELNANFTLHSYDSIYIKKIQDLMPVMFIEGAVSIASDTDLPVAPEASNKLTINFTIGENYGSLLRRYRSAFSAISDIENAYILRKGEVIPFDFSSLLYDSHYYTEELVQKYDVLVVPFRQYFVTVAGAVLKPNRFPYIPDRNWEYYVALAGGVDKNKNTNDSVAITDITGKKIRKNDVITPETIINVKTNSFLFYFNQYAPVVTTILSIITTSLMFFTLSN